MFAELPKAGTVDAINTVVPGNVAKNRRNIQPVRIMSQGFPALPNVAFLIDGNGEVTIGSIASLPCAVTASGDHQSSAMLLHREEESLEQLLVRPDRAIAKAVEDEIFIDEINYGQDDRL